MKQTYINPNVGKFTFNILTLLNDRLQHIANKERDLHLREYIILIIHF